ncbi:hypothetical protein [Methanosphaerula palustris]|uniref:Phosphoglycerate mutase n=1 Tax=Methanosphaerula palustris (strain ATCC BAA-1556 / DSM 19958 / E1-9c) TaxID=521011 RepID=B8GGI8_METPE|nr:hypothetical protein [Methanosphaerula palustris]ACL16243.1 conserved hypothetical protein [Methanosphaerula palustris E1-9c]
MKKNYLAGIIVLILGLMVLTGWGIGFFSGSTLQMSEKNVNMIFVITPDLANDPLGDINPDTANLNNQGFQRSLLMGSYLKQRVGTGNVTAIYALEPMTHLQTVNNSPDMAAIGFIQQFALLNQVTIQNTTGNSYPLYAGYAPGDVPTGVAEPSPFVPAAQGLAFNDTHGNNAALLTGIIDAEKPGSYVFSAPWETISDLLTRINTAKGYNLTLPTSYKGSNFVYVLSVTPAGKASLATLDSRLNPSATYPELPSPVARASSTLQTPFSYNRTAGVDGATIPAKINTNETVYLIRHAEAHPSSSFEDGNYVGAGQWRALALPSFLPNALRGQRSPTMVYSIDPAQSFPILNCSYARPSLTVFPYAIANNLSVNLAASFLLGINATSETAAENASNFFFTNSTGINLSNQTILVAWEHEHFPSLIKYLVDSYGGTALAPNLTWPSNDYDTIWTVKIDTMGNLTVDNALREGIDSSKLPADAPKF